MTSMTRHNSSMLVIACMAVLAVAGIAASYRIADHVHDTERAVWLADAKTETARLTEQLHSRLYRVEISVRALAERFRAGNLLKADRFRALVEESRDWDPEIHFDVVAFAERIDRSEPKTFEWLLGDTLTTVNDPGKAAPESGESFGVRVAAPPDGLVRPKADLATHPAMFEAIQTARRLPGTAVLGLSFTDDGGDRKIPVAIKADLGETEGVILAVFDLERFLAGTQGVFTTPGLSLRLIERDTEAGATAQRMAIVGEMTPGDAVTTNVIRMSRGIARWSLHWDIADTFRGGVKTEVENITRYGGSALSVLVAAALGYLIVLSLRFRQQVREKTAELSRKAMIIQLTMDSIDQGFAVWNSDHRLVIWSKRCQDFWYHPGDWLVPGLHMRKLLTHIAERGAFGPGDVDTVVEREFARIESAGANSQERFQMADGTHVHVRRFPLEHGGHVAVYTDTSVQDQAMIQLEKARDHMEEEVKRRTRDLLIACERAEQANLAKSRLLANVSHELRTPLNAIIGFSEMIGFNVGGKRSDEASREYADHIRGAGENLLAVVSDLLDVSRIETGMIDVEMTETDVGATVAEAVEIVRRGAATPEVDIVLDVSPDLPSLMIDGQRLMQVLINLTDNAVKFSKTSGAVSVFAGVDANGGMVFRITDRGIGISKQDLDRILEPFVQVQDVMIRSHEGVGLGLPLAKSLTELMNGRFEIESKPDEGTTVTLTFPRAQVGKSVRAG